MPTLREYATARTIAIAEGRFEVWFFLAVINEVEILARYHQRYGLEEEVDGGWIISSVGNLRELGMG